MDAVVVLLLGVGLALSLMDWRKGLLLSLMVGFLQDPLRKLAPGEPIYLTALVGVFLGTTLLAAIAKGALRMDQGIREWWRALRAPLSVFFVVLMLQSLHTWIRYDNLQLAGLGLVAYLAPLPATLIGYAFARDTAQIRKFLVFYVGFCVMAAVGVYLSFFGYESRVFEQVGEGLKVFSQRQGGLIEAYPGFLRSPEVAAWHAATGVCVLVILGTLARKPPARFLLALLIVLLVGGGLLTARRKMLIVPVLFLIGYWFLLAYLGRGARRLATYVPAIGVVGILVAQEVLDPQEGSLWFEPYVQHGVTGFGDAPGRLAMAGLGSVEWAFKIHGFLGVGAGAGSQGGQHFGGEGLPTAEGGLGKVLTELGVPGFLAVFWIGVVMLRLLWRVMRGLPHHERELVTLSYGLVAFLAANLLVFFVASQVYGDLFVLCILGWILGFLMAVPGMSRPGGPRRAWRAVVPGLRLGSTEPY